LGGLVAVVALESCVVFWVDWEGGWVLGIVVVNARLGRDVEGLRGATRRDREDIRMIVRFTGTIVVIGGESDSEVWFLVVCGGRKAAFDSDQKTRRMDSRNRDPADYRMG